MPLGLQLPCVDPHGSVREQKQPTSKCNAAFTLLLLSREWCYTHHVMTCLHRGTWNTASAANAKMGCPGQHMSARLVAMS